MSLDANPAALVAPADVSTRQDILLTPGPTTVPDAVLAAQTVAPRYHRGPPFRELMAEGLDGLRWMLESDDEIVVLTGSGTGALEAAVVNCFSPGDKLVVVDNGFFGDRVTRLARAFGLEIFPLTYDGGPLARPEGVA